MTSSTGTNPRAAGLVARGRLERHGVSTLSDAGLLAILAAGPNGGRTADAALDDLARIDGVTPKTATIITVAVCTGTLRTTPPSRPS